jgi:hypothetical protein
VFGHRKIPGVFTYIVVFCLVSTVLLVYQWVWPLGTRHYLSLSTGILGIVKFVSGTMWLLVIYVVALPDYRRSLWQFGVASIVTADFAVGYVLAMKWIQNLGRVEFVFDNPNLFANYIALNAFISAALLRSGGSGSLVKYFLKLSIPVFLVGIAATSSRSAAIGLVAGITFAILLSWDTRGYDVNDKTVA